jgi:hypothetical protein
MKVWLRIYVLGVVVAASVSAVSTAPHSPIPFALGTAIGLLIMEVAWVIGEYLQNRRAA